MLMDRIEQLDFLKEPIVKLFQMDYNILILELDQL